MQEALTVDKLISEIFTMGRETSSAEQLFQKFGARLKDALGLDYVIINDAYQEKSSFSGLEEFVINTNKPYIDNRLSGYSAFPELIKQYNEGFRSCMLLPVVVEGKPALVSTLLSKQEDRFDSAFASTIGLVLDMLAYQAVAKIERERSISLARYFDAAFDTYVPQLLVDKAGVIVRANKSFANVFAKTPREIGGKVVSDFFDIDGNMLYSLRNGSAAEVKDKNRKKRTYRVTCNKISDRLTHVLLYDMNEVKELEEKVRLSEQSSGEAFLLLTQDTTVLWASSNIGRIVKIDRDNIAGRRLVDLAYADSAFVSAIGDIKDTYSKAIQINIGNGIYVEAKATLLRNQLGGFSCVLASNNLEKYVASMRGALEGVVDVTSDAIVNTDSLGYIRALNKSAEKLLGYKSSDIRGSAITALYADDESAQKANNALSIAKSLSFTGNMYVNLRVKDGGEPLPCEQTTRSLVDADNVQIGYLLVLKELATKRKMEELEDTVDEIGKKYKDAILESNSKSEFIYNISHDLKTPLTNIKGFGKLLLESAGELNQEQREYVGIITNESDRLYQLIQQILDVAKLSSGKIKLDVQHVNLNELAKNPTLITLSEVAQNKGLAMGWNIDYSVPEIQADPNRLIQVFVNLIGNAIKFTETGSVSVKIFKKGRSVRVEVIDTGIGIGKEDRSKLFRKFYQLKHGLTMQQGAGTGLGLAIAREIVHLHGGKINVISEQGKGSTFWFTLPISGKRKKSAAAKQQKTEEAEGKTHASVS